MYDKNLTKALRIWCDDKALDVLRLIDTEEWFDIWSYVDSGIDEMDDYCIFDYERELFQCYMIQYYAYAYPHFFDFAETLSDFADVNPDAYSNALNMLNHDIDLFGSDFTIERMIDLMNKGELL